MMHADDSEDITSLASQSTSTMAAPASRSLAAVDAGVLLAAQSSAVVPQQHSRTSMDAEEQATLPLKRLHSSHFHAEAASSAEEAPLVDNEVTEDGPADDALEADFPPFKSRPRSSPCCCWPKTPKRKRVCVVLSVIGGILALFGLVVLGLGLQALADKTAYENAQIQLNSLTTDRFCDSRSPTLRVDATLSSAAVTTVIYLDNIHVCGFFDGSEAVCATVAPVVVRPGRNAQVTAIVDSIEVRNITAVNLFIAKMVDETVSVMDVEASAVASVYLPFKISVPMTQKFSETFGLNSSAYSISRVGGMQVTLQSYNGINMEGILVNITRLLRFPQTLPTFGIEVIRTADSIVLADISIPLSYDATSAQASVAGYATASNTSVQSIANTIMEWWEDNNGSTSSPIGVRFASISQNGQSCPWAQQSLSGMSIKLYSNPWVPAVPSRRRRDSSTLGISSIFDWKKIRQVSISKTTASNLPVTWVYDFGANSPLVGTMPLLSVDIICPSCPSVNAPASFSMPAVATVTVDPFTVVYGLQRYSFVTTLVLKQTDIVQSELLQALLANDNRLLAARGTMFPPAQQNLLNRVMAAVLFTRNMQMDPLNADFLGSVLNQMGSVTIVGSWATTTQVTASLSLPFGASYLPSINVPRIQLDLQDDINFQTVAMTDARISVGLIEYTLSISTVVGMNRQAVITDNSTLTKFYSNVMFGLSSPTKFRFCVEKFALTIPFIFPANVVSRPLLALQSRSSITTCPSSVVVVNPLPLPYTLKSFQLSSNAASAFMNAPTALSVGSTSTVNLLPKQLSCPTQPMWNSTISCSFCSSNHVVQGSAMAQIQNAFQVLLNFQLQL